MSVIIVPQLSDNYAYLIVDPVSSECAVVDCSEADKVWSVVASNKFVLTSVLTTHWHADHSGGNADLASKVPALKIFGGKDENGKIPALTNPVQDGDLVRVGNLEGRVMAIPAHTNGHVAYYFPQLKSVFTGDTLFSGGCGRVFEGNAATMLESLEKLAVLPDETKVYCGHEYTQKNLKFALTLEPSNRALQSRYDWVLKRRESNQSTMPSTIGDEKATNPFLRTTNLDLRNHLKSIDPLLADDRVSIFAKIRSLKDNF